MKKIYLIDYENVHNLGLLGSEYLTNNDRVIIFLHSGMPKTERDKILTAFRRKHAAIEFREFSSNTKNALDFNLCTYLGFLASENGEDTSFYIVSNDKGYMAAIEFMHSQNLNCRIVTDIKNSFDQCYISTIDFSKKEKLYEQLTKVFPGMTKKYFKLVAKILEDSKSKQDLHHNIQVYLKDEKAYRTVLPIFCELY